MGATECHAGLAADTSSMGRTRTNALVWQHVGKASGDIGRYSACAGPLDRPRPEDASILGRLMYLVCDSLVPTNARWSERQSHPSVPRQTKIIAAFSAAARRQLEGVQ